MLGIVKWFNESKGYGFIAPEDGSKDLFIHYKNIKSSGFKSLKDGDRVEFKAQQGPKGLEAVDVETLK